MTNRCTTCGRGDWCDCAIGRHEPPKLCIRGCLRPRKHYRDCPVEDGHDTAWLLWEPDFDPDELFDADARQDVRRAFYRELAKDIRINRETGALEVRYRCSGCLDALARHGQLCTSCHTRLAARLATKLTKVWAPWPPNDIMRDMLFSADHRRRSDTVASMCQEWTVGPRGLATQTNVPVGATGSVLWAFEHLAPDLVPSQTGGHRGKVKESPTPQAAASLGILDLRHEVLTEVGAWLAATCRAFGLHGPDWWRMRIEEASRKAWIPQTHQELADALRYIATWLDKLEELPGVVQLYDASEQLLARVAAVAPWEARPRRLRKTACPECERFALVVYQGANTVKCRRCKNEFDRERSDLWEEIGEWEKTA